jgi:hypothetical protein
MYTTSLATLPIIGLGFFSLIGVYIASYIAKRVGRFLNFRTLLILNYVVVNIMSGVAHLANEPGVNRGFYDLLTTSSSDGLENATLAAILGLVAVCLACLQKLPPSPTKDVSLTDPWLVREEKWWLVLLTLGLFPLALMATVQIQGIAAALETNRIISLTDGNAKFSFISNWLVWAVSFIAIWCIASRAGRSRVFVLLVAAASVVSIALTMAWTGGRSVVIVMVLPIVLVLLPKLRGIRMLAVPSAAVAALVYLIGISEKRSTTDSGFNLTTWLDWEWGRFSMMGFATDYVNDQGHAYGETLWASIVNFCLGTIRLLGFYIPNPQLRTSTQISGEAILGSTANYVVPGFSAEMFINFGLVGVVFGYYILGRVANWIDRKYLNAPTVLIKLTFAYVGTLLVFRTVAADSGALLSYIFYSGAPLIIVLVLSKFGRRSAAKREARQSRLAERRTKAIAVTAARRAAQLAQNPIVVNKPIVLPPRITR